MLLITFQKKNDPKTTDEFQIVKQIRSGNEKAFEELFFEYHGRLSRFAYSITQSREFARDAIQDVFLKIWRNRESFEIHHSLQVYLYQSVKNQSLNLLEKQRTQRNLSESFQKNYFSLSQENEESFFQLEEEQKRLIKRIWAAVDLMPQKRKLVFELHRKHGFSYKEIAEIMNISLKTVENHMGQALQFIRDQVGPREK